jgi:hypothetical protein
MAGDGSTRHGSLARMADAPVTITLGRADIPAFRAAVIACTEPADRQRCERLLGQVASLEATATGATVRFVAAGDTAPLARRAQEHLRAHDLDVARRRARGT